jgi:HPt (histidine-containing phosphotransfer) domain-containing protein
LAIWYESTRAHHDPRNCCVDAAFVVLTMSREWIATDAADYEIGAQANVRQSQALSVAVAKFAEQQAQTMEETRSALAAGDASTAEWAAHSLKGASANLGADPVAEEAAKREAEVELNSV